MSYIIAKQTAAKTSENIVFTREPYSKVVHVAGLLVAETIAVNVVDLDNAALPLYDTDGVAVVIAVDSIPLEITGPITLQFVKPITANAVGLQLVEVSV